MRALVRGGLVALAAAPVIAVGGAVAASANQVVTADSLCYMVASQVSNVTQSAIGGTAVAGQVLAANANTPVAIVSSTAPGARTGPVEAPAVTAAGAKASPLTDVPGKAVAVTAVQGKDVSVTALPGKGVTVTKVAGNSFAVSTVPGNASAVKADTPVALVSSNDSSTSTQTNSATATASATNNNITNQQIIQTCKVYYLPALAAGQTGSKPTQPAGHSTPGAKTGAVKAVTSKPGAAHEVVTAAKTRSSAGTPATASPPVSVKAPAVTSASVNQLPKTGPTTLPMLLGIILIAGGAGLLLLRMMLGARRTAA